MNTEIRYKGLTPFDAILKIETEDCTIEEVAECYQVLIDLAIIDHLQGSHQRAALDLIRCGYCHLRGAPQEE